MVLPWYFMHKTKSFGDQDTTLGLDPTWAVRILILGPPKGQLVDPKGQLALDGISAPLKGLGAIPLSLCGSRKLVPNETPDTERKTRRPMKYRKYI